MEIFPNLQTLFFIDSPPQSLTDYSEQELREIRATLINLYVIFDNYMWAHRPGKFANSNRDAQQYVPVHEWTAKILGIQPTDMNSVFAFKINFESPDIQDLLIGLHNYFVYVTLYKDNNTNCYIPKEKLAESAQQIINTIPELETIGTGVNRCLEKCSAGSPFAFAMFRNIYEPIIRSDPNFPNGKEKIRERPLEKKQIQDLIRFNPQQNSSTDNKTETRQDKRKPKRKQNHGIVPRTQKPISTALNGPLQFGQNSSDIFSNSTNSTQVITPQTRIQNSPSTPSDSQFINLNYLPWENISDFSPNPEDPSEQWLDLDDPAFDDIRF